VNLGSTFEKAKLCSGVPVGAGCPSGQVCASSAALGLGAGTCISRAVSAGAPVACPPAFPIAHLIVPGDRDPASSFVEKRTCTECTCGKPMGATCNAKLTLASDGACASVVGAVTAGAGCTLVDCGKQGCGSGRVDVEAMNGTCAAQPGQPTGSVELTGAGEQLCCDR
jgi:hypothetical protein